MTTTKTPWRKRITTPSLPSNQYRPRHHPFLSTPIRPSSIARQQTRRTPPSVGGSDGRAWTRARRQATTKRTLESHDTIRSTSNTRREERQDQPRRDSSRNERAVLVVSVRPIERHESNRYESRPRRATSTLTTSIPTRSSSFLDSRRARARATRPRRRVRRRPFVDRFEALERRTAIE